MVIYYDVVVLYVLLLYDLFYVCFVYKLGLVNELVFSGYWLDTMGLLLFDWWCFDFALCLMFALACLLLVVLCLLCLGFCCCFVFCFVGLVILVCRCLLVAIGYFNSVVYLSFFILYTLCFGCLFVLFVGSLRLFYVSGYCLT